MAWLSFLSKKEPEDYEQVLSDLAESIDSKKSRLADIRLRERRATLLFTAYSFVAWIAYVGVWYTDFLPRTRRGDQFEKVVRALPVAAVPVIILFTRRLVQTFYEWRSASEDKALKELLAEQKAKIAEIKKKTNFESTRNLLERFGDGTPTVNAQGTPLRQRIPPQAAPATPVQQMARPQFNSLQRPMPPYMQPSGARLPPPQTRKWYDTVADALLGPDEQTASREKYALICGKCFSHNGLVSPDEWDDVQYKCPKCGHFNPSRRALRAGQATSPSTPSPATAHRSLAFAELPAPTAPLQDPIPPVSSEGDDVTMVGDSSMMDVDVSRPAVRPRVAAFAQRIVQSAESETPSSPMKWEDFLRGMRSLGFEQQLGEGGTAVQFISPNAGERPISMHKPHPDPTVQPTMLAQWARRIKRQYPWIDEAFAPSEAS